MLTLTKDSVNNRIIIYVGSFSRAVSFANNKGGAGELNTEMETLLNTLPPNGLTEEKAKDLEKLYSILHAMESGKKSRAVIECEECNPKTIKVSYEDEDAESSSAFSLSSNGDFTEPSTFSIDFGSFEVDGLKND